MRDTLPRRDLVILPKSNKSAYCIHVVLALRLRKWEYVYCIVRATKPVYPNPRDRGAIICNKSHAGIIRFYLENLLVDFIAVSHTAVRWTMPRYVGCYRPRPRCADISLWLEPLGTITTITSLMWRADENEIGLSGDGPFYSANICITAFIYNWHAQ